MIETTIAIAVVVGVVEAIKRALNVDSKYIPLVSLVFAIFFAIIFKGDMKLAETIFTGIIVGLSASGLWDVSVKSIMQK